VVAVGRHFHDATDGGRTWPRLERWRASVGLPARWSFRNCLEPEKPAVDPSQTDVAELFGHLPVAVLVST
jgi:hypothetical protein